RARYQCPPNGQLLLLAAAEVAAAPSKHGFEDGEQREDVIGNAALAARQAGIAGLKVFLHREQWKDLAALRPLADAHARSLVGWRFFEHIAAEINGTSGNLVDPGHGTQRGRLAHTVASEDGGDPAGLAGD